MINRKVRRFKVGEHLNTTFSARQFGLALAVDVEEALKDFPKRRSGVTVDGLTIMRYYNWVDRWFSDFIEKDEVEMRGCHFDDLSGFTTKDEEVN